MIVKGFGYTGFPQYFNYTNFSGNANRVCVVKTTVPSGGAVVDAIFVKTYNQQSYGSAKVKGVVFSDSSGTPNALLGAGTEVVGITADAWCGNRLPFSSPVDLSSYGGSSVWIGYHSDTAMMMASLSSGGYNYYESNTDTYSDGTAATWQGTNNSNARGMVCYAVGGVGIYVAQAYQLVLLQDAAYAPPEATARPQVMIIT